MVITEGVTKEEIKELLLYCHNGFLHLCYKEDDDDILIRFSPEVLTGVLHAAAKHMELEPGKL